MRKTTVKQAKNNRKACCKDLKDGIIDAITAQVPGPESIIKKSAKGVDSPTLKKAADSLNLKKNTDLLKENTDSLKKKVDSLKKGINPLKLIEKVPPKIADTAKKVLPALIRRADSLAKQPVPLKKQ